MEKKHIFYVCLYVVLIGTVYEGDIEESGAKLIASSILIASALYWSVYLLSALFSYIAMRIHSRNVSSRRTFAKKLCTDDYVRGEIIRITSIIDKFDDECFVARWEVSDILYCVYHNEMIRYAIKGSRYTQDGDTHNTSVSIDDSFSIATDNKYFKVNTTYAKDRLIYTFEPGISISFFKTLCEAHLSEVSKK